MKVVVRAKEEKYECEVARTFFEKMRGLMFSGRKNILFVFDRERFFGIHSLFVFFPFDAIYLDSRKIVVDVAKGVKPFTPYLENRTPAKYLLELCEPNSLNVGDRLEW